MEGSRQTYLAAAELAGDDVTPANQVFWQIAGNLFIAAHGELNPAGPAIARLTALSKAIATASGWGLGIGARGV
jgi:hypothetical protein